jgi:hypothetical protein
VASSLTGCATLYPSQPGSIAAEVAWDGLDITDTLQSTHFADLGYAQRHYIGHGTVIGPYAERDPLAIAVYGGNRHPSAGQVLITNALLIPLHGMVSSWFDRHVEKAEQSDSDTLGLWYVGRIAWHALSIGSSGASVAGNFAIGLKP